MSTMLSPDVTVPEDFFPVCPFAASFPSTASSETTTVALSRPFHTSSPTAMYSSFSSFSARFLSVSLRSLEECNSGTHLGSSTMHRRSSFDTSTGFPVTSSVLLPQKRLSASSFARLSTVLPSSLRSSTFTGVLRGLGDVLFLSLEVSTSLMVGSRKALRSLSLYTGPIPLLGCCSNWASFVVYREMSKMPSISLACSQSVSSIFATPFPSSLLVASPSHSSALFSES
mmetsp:Transcript_12750/g.30746  ORF Transcript_12750/g.30746 Transcript_12750/m.30746 type:complete len:228 (+) Transcript_12750:560-1243(+)